MNRLKTLLKYFLGMMVALNLILIFIGTQISPMPLFAEGEITSVQGDAKPRDLTVTYLPSAEQLDAQRVARYEKKRLESSGNFWGRLVSLLGIFGLIGIAWLMSNNKKKINWRLVGTGVAIQLVFALFILWSPLGKELFAFLNDVVTRLLDFTLEGTRFLVGPLLNQFTVAFNVLPTIIFFSSLMTVLYYMGFMQLIVRSLSALMVKLMGTSGAETLSATANIFVGQTEAPLVIKPYVAKMTQSELMVVMTGGFATVAGGVMAAYVGLLKSDFPDIAGHLIAASVMSAPAALVVAKIMIPETETPVTLGKTKLEDDVQTDDANVIDAAARGAGEGMKLAINVGAMLLAFIALIALINYLIGLPSYLHNKSNYNAVYGYMESAALIPIKGCEDPKDSAQTVACTHKGLLALAQQTGLDKDKAFKDLSKLNGATYKADEDIATVEALSLLVAEKLKDKSPFELNPELKTQCEAGRISACGAMMAVTQSETWTPSLEKVDFWPSITLEVILGWLFFPIALLMGVPWSDAQWVGQLLGQKMILNEFIAYLNLGQLMNDGLLSYRSIVISTYALCGFANFGSIAIQIGGIGGIAPNRRQDLARLGIRAMIGGSLAAFMTATIAGALI